MVDGNTAALIAHEREVERNEVLYEAMVAECVPSLKRAEEALDDVDRIIESYGFEINSLELLEEIF